MLALVAAAVGASEAGKTLGPSRAGAKSSG